MKEEDGIFDPVFVKGVFDRCSTSYRYWSQIASFGFVWLWRRQCINRLPALTRNAPVGVDLMAGTGETWHYLLHHNPQIASIVAVDISSGMVRRAIDRLHAMRTDRIRVVEADILQSPIQSEIADFAICSFGLKTFNKDQQRLIAGHLSSVLRPGGVFSFVEASDPKGWPLRPIYNFYLRRFLPLIEKLFLRGAQDFAMLGIYAREFEDCSHFAQCLREEGLEVHFHKYFFGCATGVTGRRPPGGNRPMRD